MCLRFLSPIYLRIYFFPSNVTKPATYSHSYTWVVLGRRPFSSAVYFRVHAVLNARSSEFRQILSRVLVTIMAPRPCTVPCFTYGTNLLRVFAACAACTYDTIRIGRLYAHVRVTMPCERVSRILDARRNALSRCGGRLPRGDALDKQRHPRLSCLRPGKRAIAKKCECRVVYTTAMLRSNY